MMRNPVLELREKSGLSTTEIAAIIGTPERNIFRWSAEGQFPRVGELQRRVIALLKKYDIDYIAYVNGVHRRRNNKGLDRLAKYDDVVLVSPTRKRNSGADAVKWKSIDWSLSDIEIAKLLQIDPSRMPYARRKHAPVKYRTIRKMPPCMVNFSGSKLRNCREKNLLTQNEFAERVGCKKLDLVRQWEKGERIPAGNFLLRILIVLRVNAADLCD